MSGMRTCLYEGEVVHRRLAPVTHELRYRVYNFFADVDELPDLARRLKLFSYNRFNLFSIDDRKHGPGDGTPIHEFVWSLVRAAGKAEEVKRIFMFCYPRVLGYVFNPLTVYYGVDASDRLCLMIYEVNNTFGERHSYVIPVDESGTQSCDKKFYVSPFNPVEGHYEFRLQPPGDRSETRHHAGDGAGAAPHGLVLRQAASPDRCQPAAFVLQPAIDAAENHRRHSLGSHQALDQGHAACQTSAAA